MVLNLSAERFSAYGASHQLALVVLLVGAVALVWLGRSHRGSDLADRLGRLLAAAICMVTVPLQLLYFTPGFWTLERSLPLQLCDLAWMVAVYGLWTHRRWAVALTYYWGLTLTTQAIITPDLSADFPDPAFFLYWGMHSLIVWAAIYVTWGLGFAPDWHSYRTTVLATAIWAVIVFGINQVAGTNFGYLNAKPPSASILDLLGDWPYYILAEVVIIATAWALMTWPWVRLARRSGPRAALRTAPPQGDGPR